MQRQEWMSAEEWLTLLLCRLHRSADIEAEIQKVVDTEIIDTERLTYLCREQRIYPQLEDASVSSPLGQVYTEQEVQKVEKDRLLHDLRYLKYEQEILKIQNQMDASGVRMVVFKGISYYGTFYPSRRQRALGDVDIIVAREDVVKAVHCLESIGYAPTGKTMGWSDFQYEVEASRCIHTAQFLGKSGIEVELHVPTYFYTGYSLETAYKRAITQRRGIRVPELADIFWIACVHSWHHYAIRKNPMRTRFNMLGYLLDVYAGYERMRMDYTAEQILMMASEYSIADIVRFIVYAAYYVLDPERNPMELHGEEAALLDWNYGDLNLSMERRWLRSEECADMMDRQWEQTKGVLNIAAAQSAAEWPYRLQACYRDPKGRWPINILEAGGIESPLQYFDFNITWSPSHLILTVRPVGEMQWRHGTDIYDDHLTHLMLRIGTVYEQEPVNIIFQLCDGVMLPYMAPDNNPWDIYGYVVSEIQCSETESGVYTCQIPWFMTGVRRAAAGLRCYIDLQARITTKREQRYMDVCWQAGNGGCMWQEVTDCSFLGPAELQ